MKPQYILLSLCLVLAGCSYLDLEPEKKGTLQEVFEDRTSAEKFLYGCYGYLPASNDFNGEPQVWGAGDEVALTSQWGTDWHWAKAAHTGQISAAEPLYNYWSHHKSKKQPSRCAAYDLYGGIRQCYTFIDMVDGVPNASDGEKARWKAEAKFLIAYFHYSLLRLRTANQVGAHGVIIPKRRAVGLTATVAKASAGAINYTPVAKVTNLVKTMDELKKKGMWFVCGDMDGDPMYQLDLTGPIGVVIGNEGDGVSRLVKENCDFVASIPMFGDIDSLNASVAMGVLSYEIVRQKMKKEK